MYVQTLPNMQHIQWEKESDRLQEGAVLLWVLVLILVEKFLVFRAVTGSGIQIIGTISGLLRLWKHPASLYSST